MNLARPNAKTAARAVGRAAPKAPIAAPFSLRPVVQATLAAVAGAAIARLAEGGANRARCLTMQVRWTLRGRCLPTPQEKPERVTTDFIVAPDMASWRFADRLRIVRRCDPRAQLATFCHRAANGVRSV